MFLGDCSCINIILSVPDELDDENKSPTRMSRSLGNSKMNFSPKARDENKVKRAGSCWYWFGVGDETKWLSLARVVRRRFKEAKVSY